MAATAVPLKHVLTACLNSTGRFHLVSSYQPVGPHSVTYCRSGNIREVLIFANFARRTYSRNQESRKNYYYNSATEENEKS